MTALTAEPTFWREGLKWGQEEPFQLQGLSD